MFLYLNDPSLDAQVELVGSKGYGINRLHKLGIHTPEAVVVPIGDCYLSKPQVRDIQRCLDADPLIVSVRSSGVQSMPGMMDTILNVGLNDETVIRLANIHTPEFAWDCYARFIHSYATLVLGMSTEPFDQLWETARLFSIPPTQKTCTYLVERFKKLCPKFPQDFYTQLTTCVNQVWMSWYQARSVNYRQAEGISGSGTAIIIQRMVFGNLNEDSCSGVYFSRNPATGGEGIGEFAVKTQGDELVNGTATTRFSVDHMPVLFPDAHLELCGYAAQLEVKYQDMVDIEFTVENNKLWILQVRPGKRSHRAMKPILEHLLLTKAIDRETYEERLQAIPSVVVDPTISSRGWTKLGVGQTAYAADVEGLVALSSVEAVRLRQEDKRSILFTDETTPMDVLGIIASVGIVTTSGGLLSHAAVICTSWNKPCIVGLKTNRSLIKTGTPMLLKKDGSVWVKS